MTNIGLFNSIAQVATLVTGRPGSNQGMADEIGTSILLIPPEERPGNGSDRGNRAGGTDDGLNGVIA